MPVVTRVAVFGCGRMGSAWARAFDAVADVSVVVDPDPEAGASVATAVGATHHPSLADATPAVDGADVWCVAAPGAYHYPLLDAALDRGVPRVLVEKEATAHPDESADLCRRLDGSRTEAVHVDYLEVRHPVFRAAVDRLPDDFVISRGCHWRGKWSRRVAPHCRGDLVHDLSELHRASDALGIDALAPTGGRMRTWTASVRTAEEPAASHTDVGGRVAFATGRGGEVVVRGSFDAPLERRYFCWVDDDAAVALVGSTVSRDHLTPRAYEVRGEAAVSAVHRALARGGPTTDHDFERVADRVGAELVAVGSDADRLRASARELVEGRACALPDLREAHAVERTARAAYEVCGFESVYDHHPSAPGPDPE